MNIFEGFESIKHIPNPVLTIGTFDGVHLGHQKIIEKLNKEAQKIGGESVLFTFHPHPRMVLYPESHGVKLIQTQEEKLCKLRRMGLQNIIVHPFTMEFSRLTALEFVRDYLVNRLHVKKVVIGYDHQFGKNREGSVDYLKEVCDTYGFDVIEIDAQEMNEVNISSTKIRKALSEGDMELAERYLGEPFEINGVVVEGQALGREIGFRTANIDLKSEVKILPFIGVYAVNVLFPDNRVFEGMMNIGSRPTISEEQDATIEVHLFDFNEDIYGKELTIQIGKRIRAEQKFDSLEELKNQLTQDEISIRSYFNN